MRALCVFDDGHGPALYAGGNFSFAGFPPPRGVAKWDARSWTPVGGRMDLAPRGAAPYAVGHFYMRGNSNPDMIAKRDGQAWSLMGASLKFGMGDMVLSDP